MTTAYFILAIIIGFSLLIWGADRFVDGAASIARNFGVSPLIVGLTIVAFGTSAPEMLVSGLAAYDGVPSLGIGNAIGSNIANIGMVLGITLLISPLVVNNETLKREFPILTVVMVLALLLLWDQYLSFIDGLILFTGFILVLFIMALLAINSAKATNTEEDIEEAMTTQQASFSFVIGLTTLLLGSKALVWGASEIALSLGVSELVIGLTIVAIGTSLPELAASVTSVLKNEHDLAIGNIVGSNIFNILAVLAMPGLIMPSQTDPQLLLRDFSIMVLLFVLLYLFAKLSPNGQIGRSAGALMLLIYIVYNGFLAYQSTAGLSV